MRAAEETLAERTLETGVGAAILNTAQAGAIALVHTGLVLHVAHEVVVLGLAALSRAHGIVVGNVVGMHVAESPSAILADLARCISATRKPPAHATFLP
jgi:dUTPase